MRGGRDDGAELALSAMVTFIAIMVTSAIIASILIGVVQMTFNNAQEHGSTQSDSVNGLMVIQRFELSSYSNPGNDVLYLTFEMPYLINPIPDSTVEYSLLCPNGANTAITYDVGDFDTATELSGNGNDANAIDHFENRGNYHIFITIGADCDIEPGFKGDLVIAIEGGRTLTLPIDVGQNPETGMTFI